MSGSIGRGFVLNKLLNTGNMNSNEEMSHTSPPKSSYPKAAGRLTAAGRGTCLMTPSQFTKGSRTATAVVKPNQEASAVLVRKEEVPSMTRDGDEEKSAVDVSSDIIDKSVNKVETVLKSASVTHDHKEKDETSSLPSSVEVVPLEESANITKEVEVLATDVPLANERMMVESGEVVQEEAVDVEEASAADEASVPDLMTELMGGVKLRTDSSSTPTLDDNVSTPTDDSDPSMVLESINKSEIKHKPIELNEESKSRNVERSEDEKWKIYQVERKVNNLIKNVSVDNLGDVFMELECLVEERPLSSRYRDCSEVQVLCEAIIQNAVQRSDFLPLAPCLIKLISERQPIEFKQFFQEICDAKRKDYVSLSASDEYLNNYGQNFCVLLGHLYALPRQTGPTLFNVVRVVVNEYVERWSWPDSGLSTIEGGVREQEMAVSASALRCLLKEITNKMLDNDEEVERGMEKFVWLMRESILNTKVPRKVREIYLDGYAEVQSYNEESGVGSQISSTCGGTNSQDDSSEVEITAVVEGRSINPLAATPSNHSSEHKDNEEVQNEVDFERLENPPIDTIAMAPTNAYVSKKVPSSAQVNMRNAIGGRELNSPADDSEPDIIVEEEYSNDEGMDGFSSGNFNQSSSPASSDIDDKFKLPIGRGRGLARLPDFTVKSKNIPVANVLPIGYNSCLGVMKQRTQNGTSSAPGRGRGRALEAGRGSPGGSPKFGKSERFHQPSPPMNRSNNRGSKNSNNYDNSRGGGHNPSPRSSHREGTMQGSGREKPRQQQIENQNHFKASKNKMKFRPVYHENKEPLNNSIDNNSNNKNTNTNQSRSSQQPGRENMEKFYHPDGRLEYIPKPDPPRTGGFGSVQPTTCLRCSSSDHRSEDCPDENFFF